jgi:hypothetical protein
MKGLPVAIMAVIDHQSEVTERIEDWRADMAATEQRRFAKP